MSLEDLVIEGIETAGPSTTAEALAVLMADANVGSIVIEEEMQPMGIVTDRDLAVRVDAEGRSASEVPASEIMTESPATVPVDAGLLDVTRAMAEYSVRRMPVVDESGTLVGIITLDDLILLLSVELANLATVIETESPAY